MDKYNSRYKEYTDHFSEEVSEEIKEFAKETAFKFSRYIFTKKEGNEQFGHCTHCKAEFKTKSLHHNEEIICPSCNSEVTVKSSGMSRKYMIDEVYFVYFEKSIKDPNVLIARGIHAKRDYRSNYKNIKTNYFLRAMYIFDSVNHKSVMLKQSYYNAEYEKKSSIFSLSGPLEQKGIRTSYSRESIAIAVKDTPFRYSTWESYHFKDMIEFFDLFTLYPSIEYLTKEALHNLVENKLNGECTYRSINWKGTTIFKILKLTKSDFKEIKLKKINITFSFLKVLQDSKKFKWNLTIEEIDKISKEYFNNYDSLVKIAEYSSMRKLLNYFSKQYKNYNETKSLAETKNHTETKDYNETIEDKLSRHYYSEGSVFITFKDYVADCILLGMDISKDQVLFPKDIYTAHQNTIKQIKLTADESLNLKIKARVKDLEKYYFEHNDLIIRPAESSNELIEEGKSLSHCVGTYANRYAKGETNILFIRKVAELDKPYYTVEIKKDIIIQVHGKNNRSADKDVVEFIKVFTEERLNKQGEKVIKQNEELITSREILITSSEILNSQSEILINQSEPLNNQNEILINNNELTTIKISA